MAHSQYEHLFSPLSIGKVQLRNRIVKTAAQTYFFESGENRVGSIAKAFYGAVARGGAGLIIVETPAMEWPLAETGDRRFRVDDDKYIKNLSELDRRESTSTAVPSSCSSTIAVRGGASITPWQSGWPPRR